MEALYNKLKGAYSAFIMMHINLFMDFNIFSISANILIPFYQYRYYSGKPLKVYHVLIQSTYICFLQYIL